MEITIDRTQTLDLNPPFYPMFSSYFKVVYENPKSLALTKFNPDQIQLKKVFSLEEMRGIESSQFNKRISQRLAELDKEYILLDAAVAGALIAHEEIIPKEWIGITDADSITEKTGDIGFYGTQFCRKETAEAEDVYVLTPFFNRGHWEGEGHDRVFLSADLLGVIDQNLFGGNMLKFAAIYPLP